MYTQCPHCQTCFRIAEDHLRIAGGKVRCGSCQEVFDATRTLFRNLSDRTPITDFKAQAGSKPAAAPKPSPQPAPRPANKPAAQATTPRPAVSPPAKPSPSPATSPAVSAKTTPPPPRPTTTPRSASTGAESLRRERDKAPDQSHFMESVVGNDRYNNLDDMGSIKIPGDISFGDSIIKFADEAEKKAPPSSKTESKPTTAGSPGQARTPYEDLDAKDGPATDDDIASLKNFLDEVDAQLHEDETDTRSQLDKDIDELLAFTDSLDSKKTPASHDKPENKLEDEFDLDALAEFEKELELTDTGKFKRTQKPAPESEKFTESQKLKKKSATDLPPAAEEIEITPPAEPAAPTEHKPEAAETKAAAAEKKSHTDSTRIEAPELPESDAIAEEDIPRALRRSLDMLDQTPRRSLGMTMLMSLAILVLLGGLGFQLLLFRNVELAHKFPQLVPYLNQFCDRLPCRYSGKVDVSQIKLISRNVRSHPTQANALLITATFVNKAAFDQPYPDIEITLYDLGGNVVASRSFTPREYLEKMYNRFLLMESGTPVQVTLAVLDPGKDAINFEFSFHY